MVGKYHHWWYHHCIVFTTWGPAEVTQLSFLLHVFHHVDDLLHWSDIWPRCAHLFSTHNVEHLESWKPQDSTFSIFFNIPWLPVSSLLFGGFIVDGDVSSLIFKRAHILLGLSWLHQQRLPNDANASGATKTKRRRYCIARNGWDRADVPSAVLFEPSRARKAEKLPSVHVSQLYLQHVWRTEIWTTWNRFL